MNSCRYMHGSEFRWSTAMGCNFSFILVPPWVNFSNRYMYGWSKIVHLGTWMGLTSYTVVHGWVTFPSKLVHGWVMGGGTSKFPEAHPYPDQSWVPPDFSFIIICRVLLGWEHCTFQWYSFPKLGFIWKKIGKKLISTDYGRYGSQHSPKKSKEG